MTRHPIAGIALAFLQSVALISPALAAIPVRASIGVVLKPITKNARALADDEIVKLAKIAGETRGTKSVGKVLGHQNLPIEVVEDTYLRIAVQQRHLPRSEAEGMFRRLSGTPGFSNTLSKIIGTSAVKTAGHLNELRIADSAQQNGFEVLEIGHRFADGFKGADTDIDVLLRKGGRVIAIETKDYAPTTLVPLSTFRGDMQSLDSYRKLHPDQKVLAVFWMTSKPQDPGVSKSLEAAAQRFQVKMVFGGPSFAIHQIPIHLIELP